MTMQRRPVPILIIDDDHDDCEMMREAFKESRLLNSLHFVHDGEEALRYLKNEGKFQGDITCTRPGLILLDLNMPRMDGREFLSAIKSDDCFKQIPVVILTTSQAEEDIYRAYNLGVNSFITKPVSFSSFVELMSELGHYWLEIVTLPQSEKSGNK